MTLRIAAAGLAATLALALLGIGGASAAKKPSFRSDVKITSGGPNGAQGTVTSKKAACKKNRTVTLYRAADSIGSQSALGPPAGTKYGTDRTNRNGQWEIDAALVIGEYFGVVDLSRHRLFNCAGDIGVRVRL